MNGGRDFALFPSWIEEDHTQLKSFSRDQHGNQPNVFSPKIRLSWEQHGHIKDQGFQMTSIRGSHAVSNISGHDLCLPEVKSTWLAVFWTIQKMSCDWL